MGFLLNSSQIDTTVLCTCNKGKQHKASYKAITAVSTISEPLQLLHMDLFGPTSIRSIDHKHYSLVVTDDFSRFSWVFFLGTKDETFYILRDFITFVENQLTKKVKAIRCDNGTEFKNSNLIELCGSKGIKRDYSVARTPTTKCEAVSTACYVLNRVLVTRPHNKTPYELLSGKVPNISHLKPFGCHVTILNTSDHLGKFEGKANEGFLVGLYSFQNLMQPAGPRIKLFCHIGEYIRLSRGTSYAQRQVYEANSIAKESW
ncbi:putative ribonuclease H-like domain-containing protein [Tanacetum coccineum]